MIMAVGATAQNFDFSAVAPSGQTLYYKIMDASSVSVVYPQYASGDFWNGYTKPTGTLSIPSTVTNAGTTYTVTSIGFNAFYECDNLFNITMPTSLTSIGNDAFYGCDSLQHIVIPEGVASVGDSSFYECELVQDISLPSTILSIGKSAFQGLSHITTLTLPRALCYVGGRAFAYCTSLTTLNYNADSCWFAGTAASWGVPATYIFWGSNQLTTVNFGSHVRFIPTNAFRDKSLTSISFPNSLRRIGGYAFAGCTSLTSVDFGNGVETIQNYAFDGCSQLSSLSLPNSVKAIGLCAFRGCSFSELTLPSSLQEIDNNAFASNNNLTNVTLNADSCFTGSAQSSDAVFASCPHLTTITFGNNVKAIPDRFCASTPITTVFIPNSVKVIGDYAFSNCNMLTNVNIGNSVEDIGESSFRQCTALTSIVFPNSLKYLRGECFWGSGLRSVTIPHNVSYIGDYAFMNCSNLDTLYYNADSINIVGNISPTATSYQAAAFPGTLTYVEIGSNVRVIPGYAFEGKTLINSINIPNSVHKISQFAFNGCSGLTSLLLGNAIGTIENSAFNGCSGLGSILLPEALVYVGSNAFSGCSNLTTLTVPANVKVFPQITGCTSLTTVNYNADSCSSSNIFKECRSITTLNIGNNVRYVPQYFAYNDTLITSLIIPPSVKNIASYAFYGCKHIDTVALPDSLRTISTYAFANCARLSSLKIPASVKSIGSRAFNGCYRLQTLHYDAENCNSIGEYAFGPSINALYISQNVSYLPNGIFTPCTNLVAVYAYPTVPPMGTITNVFSNAVSNVPLYVPCTAVYDYTHGGSSSSWRGRFSNIQLLSGDYAMHIGSNDSEMGSAEYLQSPCENGVASFQAVPTFHHRFAGWNDGNNDNPRSITLSADTSFTAIFEPDTFRVTATPSVDSMGAVTGSGIYFRNDEVYLYAFPVGGNVFTGWNDNTTDNPYIFTVTGNVQLTADFAPASVDTLFVTDTLLLTDTLNVFLHDTTIVDNWIYDTTYLWQYDTTYIDNYIHDTTYIDNYIHDTTIVENWVYDTTIVTDTLWMTQFDTVWMTLYDTVWLHDTVIVHDTVYIPQEGINDIEAANIMLYQRDGRIVVDGAAGKAVYMYDISGRLLATREENCDQLLLDVPASGAYLIKVGNMPARKIVVIR